MRPTPFSEFCSLTQGKSWFSLSNQLLELYSISIFIVSRSLRTSRRPCILDSLEEHRYFPQTMSMRTPKRFPWNFNTIIHKNNGILPVNTEYKIVETFYDLTERRIWYRTHKSGGDTIKSIFDFSNKRALPSSSSIRSWSWSTNIDERRITKMNSIDETISIDASSSSTEQTKRATRW